MSRGREGFRSRARLVAVALALGAGLAWVGPASAGVGVWGPSHGPEGGRISALAADPQNPKTLYAAGTGGGVFKSTDGGRKWRVANAGLGVSAFAIDPRRPATVYAGSFKSTDGGRSWRPMAGLTVAVSALAIDPKSPATVYAGTWSRGVFKSAVA